MVNLIAPTYEVKVQQASEFDVAPEETIVANDLQYTYLLNRAGSINFNLPLLHTDAAKIDPGRTRVRIYRNGDLVWGGYIWSATASWRGTGGNLSVRGEGWWSILNHRNLTVDRTFTNWEQLDLVWHLIDFTDNIDELYEDDQVTIDPDSYGKIYFTRGSALPSGVVVTRIYKGRQYKNIAEAIEEFAEAETGFDFEVTPDRVWNTYYPSRGSRLDGVLDPQVTLGETATGASLTVDASNMATNLGVLGAGVGEDQLLVYASANDQAGYKPGRQRYGVLDDTYSFIEIEDETALLAKAREMRRVRSVPRIQPQFSLSPTDALGLSFGSNQPGKFFLGDEVQVNASFGYFAEIDDFFRIIAIEVQMAKSGREAITVQVDEPVANYESPSSGSWSYWR